MTATPGFLDVRDVRKAYGAIKAVDRSWHDTPAYLYLRIRQLRELDPEKSSASGG